MRKLSLMVAALLVLPACAVLGSESWYTGYGRKSLMQRASFDLDCGPEKISDQPLAGYLTIGLKGCGKQATYKYVDRLGWVMNTASHK